MKTLIVAAMMLMNEKECGIVTPDNVFTDTIINASVEMNIPVTDALSAVVAKAMELRRDVLARTDMPMYCEAVRNHFTETKQP